jgi:hypothetical protein
MSNDQRENIVAELYDGYSSTQKVILETEKKRTRNKLITLAILIFAMDLLGLAVMNAITAPNMLIIAVIPVIFIGLAFLAMKEPLLAMIIASVILLAAWIYTIVIVGSGAAVTGWLTKALAVYLILAGFQSAREANRIRKELKL